MCINPRVQNSGVVTNVVIIIASVVAPGITPRQVDRHAALCLADDGSQLRPPAPGWFLPPKPG
jgi:hypothetical protein